MDNQGPSHSQITLWTAGNITHVDMLKAYLASANIATHVTQELLVGVMGETSCTEWPKLMLVDGADEARARPMVDVWLQSFDPDKVVLGEGWTCSCGESLEGQFASCWKCGTSKPE